MVSCGIFDGTQRSSIELSGALTLSDMMAHEQDVFGFHFRLHPIGLARVGLSSEDQWFQTYTLQTGLLS